MKLFKKILIAISIFSVGLFQENVYAVSSVDYTVKSVYMNTTIDFLGSMHIVETIVVEGSLNGYELGINYKNSNLSEWNPGDKVDFSNSAFYNARAVDVANVSSYKIDKEDDKWNLTTKFYDAYDMVDSAKNGDSGVYVETKTEDGVKIRIYNPNESGYVVYIVDYYISQPVVLHNDVAELYWNFLPKDFDYVEKATIQVIAPGTSTKDTFRFWAHGSLNGKISGISDAKDENGNIIYKGALASVEDVKEGSGITIRMTFDKSSMTVAEKFLNKSNVDGLDEIIKVENERAKDANMQRVYVKIIYYGTFVLAGFYLIGLIVIWIYIYKKYDKEYRIAFDHKFYREFTGDYSVEVVDYLMKKDITTDAFSASIMNLIYKKNISIDELSNEKNNTKLTLKSKDGLSASENILVELLFEKIGSNREVTLKDIEKYSKSAKTAQSFMDKYDSWKNSVTSDAKKEEFFESKSNPKTIGWAYFGLGILLCVLIGIFNPNAYLVIMVLIVFAFILLIYSNSFKKWSIKGREHYLKWNAFKNFLNEFGNFSDKELPEITLWEKYLVYATVFGIAKKVQSVMKVRLTELGDETMITTYPTLARSVYIGDTINTSISRAYSSSMATINAQNASSSMSSGSGFGGGFSSGGGFGGGGGSGRGF